MSSWIQTYTGRRFDPMAPRAEDVCVEDVAHALSMQCRYNGHTRDFYSVAEHSVLVSRHCDPEYAREGLLHDAAEAYLGDVIRPLKRQPVMRGYLDVEVLVEAAVAEHFDLRAGPDARAAWKEVDDRILVDEIGALMARPEMYAEGRPWLEGKAAVGAEILCYSPKRAEMLFLLRFWELFPERAPGNDVKITIG